MLFDNLYEEENEEAYTSYTEYYYNSRSHQDGEKQFCENCNAIRDFLSFKAQYPILSVAGWGCKPKPIGLITFRF